MSHFSLIIPTLNVIRLTRSISQAVIWLLLGIEKATGGLLEAEKQFVDASTGKKLNFDEPFSNPKDGVELTVIIPAYKEEARLSLSVDEMIPFLKEREAKDKRRTWEIMIVDDGSTDRTTEVGLEYVKREGSSKVRVLTLKKNRGKGGAVKRGMMVARGKYMLFADADGATRFSDINQLETKIAAIEKQGHGIAVGSRAHLEEEDVVRRRSILRNILMWGFHFLVSFVGGIHGIRDTQCGFKLFTRDTAKIVFSNLHVERWCFDVELLFIAAKFNIPVVEVAVNWQEIDGSKLDTFWSTLQMLRDLFRIRLCYTLGIWSAKK
jgi:dolichyl-phosphate beta-glucosyltransferase